MALNTTNPSQRQGSNYVCKAHGKLNALPTLLSNSTFYSQNMPYTQIRSMERANIKYDSKTNKHYRNETESGSVKQTTRYWLSLPTLEAHKKTHPVKQAAVFSQKVNPAVAQMIAELFADGITEVNSMKKAPLPLQSSPPDPNHRAYFPLLMMT